MAAAEAILGNRMTRSAGGFFLWLEVGNGEEFAVRAWRRQGVRDPAEGGLYGPRNFARKTQCKPSGFSYARVALVNDLSKAIMTALERLREVL